MSEITTEFEEIIESIIPEIDATGLPIIPGRRRSLKIAVYAEGYCDSFLFGATIEQAIERARAEWKIPEDVEVEARRIGEGSHMKFRIN